MTTPKKAKKPRKPRLSQPWKSFAPRLVNKADTMLHIYSIEVDEGVPVIIGYPSEMRKLGKTLIAWADWSDAKWKK